MLLRSIENVCHVLFHTLCCAHSSLFYKSFGFTILKSAVNILVASVDEMNF
jgi:hypothetical protein